MGRILLIVGATAAAVAAGVIVYRAVQTGRGKAREMLHASHRKAAEMERRVHDTDEALKDAEKTLGELERAV